ncbi:hypothetical protein [Streptomyces griseosporeus]|uniref:hypothetical protein n=1 Tax=Streptomyces griseosporeus TaxID=1910 RepID=UPI00167CDF0C|nr:hypothetical protein [Streptomyces griseosporeus]GHF77831.1 hypothetical protein GCM10018783_55020 [Streptomyces griseosporeus]
MAEPRLRATEEGGRVVDDPTEEELHDLLSEMNLWHRYVILERCDLEPRGQHYMQAYLNDDMSYQVEYRAGGPDQHYQTHISTPHELDRPKPVADLMMDWAHDRPGWREAVPWVPLRV